MAEAPRCCLARWFWFSISYKVAIKVLAGAAIISRLESGRIRFQAHSLRGWQASGGLFPSSFIWLLASLSLSLHGPLPRAASQHGSRLPPIEGKRQHPKWKPLSLYSRIPVVTSHHTHHSLLPRDKSVSPAHRPTLNG